MTTVNELAGWDPSATGSSYRAGSNFTIPAEQVIVKRFVQLAKNCVQYICTFQGRPVPYSFDTQEEKMAKKLATILKNSIEISLRDVGLMEIPED
jgi:hypothetical protein